jgi:hypothetical protein
MLLNCGRATLLKAAQRPAINKWACVDYAGTIYQPRAIPEQAMRSPILWV